MVKIPRKKSRKNRTQTLTFEQLQFGPEPVVSVFSEAKLGDALNWYNYFYNPKDGRKWLEGWVKKNRPKDLPKIRKVDDCWISSTAAAMAKMIDNGTEFPDSKIEFINFKIDMIVDKVDSIKEEIKAPTVSPYDRAVQKAKGQLIRLEEEIDKFFENYQTAFSMYEFVTAEGCGPAFINPAKILLKKNVDEMKEYADDFINEKGKVKYKAMLAFYETLYYDLDRKAENRKVTRKARVTKLPSTEKLLKGFKYKDKDDTLKLVSITPENILGAKQLWVYNVKYRTIGVFNSLNDLGLSIKGTSITQFNEETSIVRKTRKPEEKLKEFFEQGRVGIRNFMLTIKSTEYKAKGRISEDVILLKVIK